VPQELTREELPGARRGLSYGIRQGSGSKLVGEVIASKHRPYRPAIVPALGLLSRQSRLETGVSNHWVPQQELGNEGNQKHLISNISTILG